MSVVGGVVVGQQIQSRMTWLGEEASLCVWMSFCCCYTDRHAVALQVPASIATNPSNSCDVKSHHHQLLCQHMDTRACSISHNKGVYFYTFKLKKHGAKCRPPVQGECRSNNSESAPRLQHTAAPGMFLASFSCTPATSMNDGRCQINYLDIFLSTKLLI